MTDYSDDIDRAGVETERQLQRALAARKPEGPAYTGRCAWCDEPTEPGRRFCRPAVDDCQARWERQAKR